MKITSDAIKIELCYEEMQMLAAVLNDYISERLAPVPARKNFAQELFNGLVYAGCHLP